MSTTLYILFLISSSVSILDNYKMGNDFYVNNRLLFSTRLENDLSGDKPLIEKNSNDRPVIYGLEFLSGGTGALCSHLMLYRVNNEKQWENGSEPYMYGIGYALTTTATTTAGVHLIGTLFNQKGNLNKAAIGAGIASSFVSFIGYNYHRFGIEYCLLPPVCATIGYNWDRSKFFRQAGIYTFECMGGCVGLGISFFITGTYLYMNYRYNGFDKIIPFYTISNMVFTSTTTTITGRLFKEKGSWLKAMIGAGAGAFISSYALYYWDSHNYKPWPKIVVIPLVLLPPIGAVVGYNLK